LACFGGNAPRDNIIRAYSWRNLLVLVCAPGIVKFLALFLSPNNPLVSASCDHSMLQINCFDSV